MTGIGVLLCALLGADVADIVSELQSSLQSAPNLYAEFDGETLFSGDISNQAVTRSKVGGTLYRRGKSIDVHVQEDADWPESNGGTQRTEYWRIVDDDYREFESSGSVAAVGVSSKKEYALAYRLLGDACVLDGVLPGSEGKGIIDLIPEAQGVRLLSETEKINGTETLIVEFETQYGTHKLWLAPDYGLLPVRIQVAREEGDLFNGQAIGTPPPQSSPEAIHTWPQATITSNHVLVTINEFTKIGEVFVPTSASIENIINYATGEQVVSHTEHRRSSIQLEPEFAAMGAFKLDVPNATPAAFLDERGITGLHYQWSDGEIVPVADTLVFDKIDLDMPDIVSHKSANQPLPTEQDSLPARQETRRADRRWFLYSPVVVFGGAIIVGAFVLSRRKKRA